LERTFKMIKVIDNFLDKGDFNEMKEIIMGKNFPWYHYDQPVDNYLQWDFDKTPQEIKEEAKRVSGYWFMVNSLYDNNRLIASKNPASISVLKPIISKLNTIDGRQVKELIRAKFNFYPNQGKFIEHTWHQDTDYTHKGCLLAFNTCNGYTKFKDGTKVESVENRALLFDPSIEHTSTNTTNAPRRVNMNINYF